VLVIGVSVQRNGGCLRWCVIAGEHLVTIARTGGYAVGKFTFQVKQYASRMKKEEHEEKSYRQYFLQSNSKVQKITGYCKA
jgi:hypothetical protein